MFLGRHFWVYLATMTLCVALCIGRGVRAETGEFNVHGRVGPGFALGGWQSGELGPGIMSSGSLEWAFSEHIGLDAGAGYLRHFQGQHPEGYEPIGQTDLLFAGLGARLRWINDETGYLWSWSGREDHVGNLWGNLWTDFHLDYVYTGGKSRFGLDVGTGFQLSVVNALQMGPFVRAMYVQQPDSVNDRDSADMVSLQFGLEISLAIPMEGKVLEDSDEDGIYDVNDVCPKAPEDVDGFEDADGCPDEDNDADGIFDYLDACPMEAEDSDDFEDGDGCPDPDNDGDGIVDTKDTCHLLPEDFDGFEDADGCPDTDNDGDGIEDQDDKCPNEKETQNGIEDEDGCPEPDADGDGFLDAVDACPSQAETINGIEDSDGCPDEGLVKVYRNKILFGERVFFGFNKSRVRRESRELLQHIAGLLEEHPEYALISIEGHADKVGSNRFNLKLSRKRAQAVRDALVKLGVSPERLVTRGYGERAPLVEGESEEIRSKNRRVEFAIEKLDVSLAKTPVSPETKRAVDGEGEKPEAGGGR